MLAVPLLEDNSLSNNLETLKAYKVLIFPPMGLLAQLHAGITWNAEAGRGELLNIFNFVR